MKTTLAQILTEKLQGKRIRFKLPKFDLTDEKYQKYIEFLQERGSNVSDDGIVTGTVTESKFASIDWEPDLKDITVSGCLYAFDFNQEIEILDE